MAVIRPNQKGEFLKLLGEHIRLFVGDVALGNATQFRVGMIRTKKGVFIGVENHGAYEFQGLPSAPYVASKLSIFEHDALNFADFICDQLQPGTPRQGNYNYVFCERHDDFDVEA